jgi:hypothetical protein
MFEIYLILAATTRFQRRIIWRLTIGTLGCDQSASHDRAGTGSLRGLGDGPGYFKAERIR